ncbi:Nucleoporin like protein [Verticillium longisporum]|nr:Nucleoporin like protein [Verticillium longisporum]
MALLGALVVNASKAHDDPPSLLGYLGPLLSRSFLQLLSGLGKPFLQSSEVCATWHFFSIIVQNRQQWMSNCLLTGKTPRDALSRGDNKTTESATTSVLSTAFAKLKAINDLEREEALKVLDFVSSAQNHWPWTIFTMQRDSSYFESLRRFVRELQTSSTTARTDATKAAVEAKMAAYVAEIFAMQLYHQRQMGGAEELAKSLVADLDYFLRDGVEVASYNNSLHNNFTKNFASKYPGVSLDSLKRTALEPRELGEWYYYALDRANTMLDFDPGWHGRRDDGFRNEMGIANANLSLVDAQISLFHAWEFLLLELSSSLPENPNVQKQMLQVAQQCLNANQSTQGPENIFVRIVEDRANLALMLLRRLVGTSPTSQDIKQILGSLFSVINAVQDPFGPESIEYHRTILKTVYVTLRLYGSADKESLNASTSGPKGSSTTLTQTILNLLDTVVAKGFRSLISLSLFHAWEFLLLELSSSLPENSNVQKQMLQVAQQCLNANQSTQGPENIFVRIVEDRANLALMLLRRLVGTSPTSQDIKQILGSLFSVINAVQDPFGPESIEYHRTILKTVYVTLRLYGSADKESLHASTSGPKGSSTTLTQTILNLLDTVVAKGFRSLISLVHDSNAAVAPEDFALLTAILQACLSMPAMDQCQTQILNIMASYDAMHAATSLFSWSDKLSTNSDPIYGELSLLFLLELSTLPTLAEQMAADGLLSHLTSANITNYMRKGIISPFSDVVGAQRCYSIWAKGVLPLLLNLLTALGGTVAPEVAYVLNQFPHLLKSSVERFEAPGASRTASRDAPHYVTLLAVSEVHSLALLTKVIGALRVNNNRDIPEVDWDAASLLENVDFWLSTRKLLKERLLPLGQREVEWRGAAIDAAGDERKPDNVLEAKVVAQMEAVRDVLMEDLE